MASANLLDIAKLNGNDVVVGLIEENIKYNPELSVFPMRTIRGTSYTTGVRTGLPSASFRTANDGVTPSKSTFVKRLVECYILASQVEVDLAVAQAYEDGPGAFEMIEASGVMRAALSTMASQIWYGTTNDANGFPGLKAFTPTTSAYVVNSGGSDALKQSSIYMVRFGPQAVQLIAGNNASLALSAFRDVTLTNATSGGKYAGREASLTGWFGLATHTAEACVRAYNVGDFGETNDMCDDALLGEMLEKFPAGITPDAIFMARRSRRQLQLSRTVTLSGSGSTRPSQPTIAPIPTEFEGIPIYVTDSIGITDAVNS